MNEAKRIIVFLVLVLIVSGIKLSYVSYRTLEKENAELKTRLTHIEEKLNETEKLCIGLLDSIKNNDPTTLKEYINNWGIYDPGTHGEYGRFSFRYSVKESKNDVPCIDVIYLSLDSFPDIKYLESMRMWNNLYNAPLWGNYP